MLSTTRILYHREIKLLSTILDWLFSARCVGCRARGAYLCDHCIERAPAAEAVPLPDTLALFSYDYEPVKRAIWLLKYRGVRHLGQIFGPAVYERLLEPLAEVAALYPGDPPGGGWLAVPIPLSSARLRKRGFNQAEILARALVACDPITFTLAPMLLAKITHTPTQVSIKDRRTRLANLAGAFTVHDVSKVTGRNIILIDDVITTGATMSEARRVLKQAGARRILGVALAHG